MSDYEYSNGACGSCQECGAETDEEWHRLCSDCYAEDQGWRRPDPDALRAQHEDRDRIVTARLLERLDELERRVRRLEADARRNAA